MMTWIFSLLMVFLCSILLALVLTIESIDPHEIWFLQKAGLMPTQGINYQLDNDLILNIDGLTLTIDSGFETDLASIPRILWPFFAPNDDYSIYPAIVHDYLYSCGNISRKFADDVLYSFLIKQDTSYLTALNFYLAVRFFGGAHFSKQSRPCEFILETPGGLYVNPFKTATS